MLNAGPENARLGGVGVRIHVKSLKPMVYFCRRRELANRQMFFGGVGVMRFAVAKFYAR